MRKAVAFITFLLTLNPWQQVAVASIPENDKSITWNVAPPADFDKQLISKETINKYVPTNLTPTTNQFALGQELQTKMGQRIADDLINNELFKKSKTGQMVEGLKKVTDRSFSLGSAEPGHVVHTFKFQMKPVEKFAQLDYTGFFTSSVVYTLDSNVAKISLSRPLDEALTLSLTDITNMNVMDFNPNLVLTYKF